MTTTDTNKEYSFTLKRINLLEKSLRFTSPISKGEEFAFNISLQVAGTPDAKESVHIMGVDINRKKDGEKLGSIQLGCTFSIQNFEEYVSDGNNIGALPQDLLYLLNTVVIGTMRGVMFSEFRGTFLSNAYLPVLDPRGFEKAD